MKIKVKIKPTKKLKKKILILISALLMLSVCTALFSACSRKSKDTEKETDTEIATLSASEHLSPGESATEPTSEPEPDTQEATDTDTLSETNLETDTESPTEAPTETPTEAPTEEPTEPETEPAPSLKYISFDNGTCAVSGIGDVKDVYVVIPEKSPSGDVVVAIEDKAFYENSTVKAVQIPSTVMSIGDMAFGGCSSLVYVSVDEKNRAYIDVDGILYTKDKTKLILLPGANPTSEIFISASVTEIAAMAIYNNSSLKSIKYGGTLSDWNKIKIGDKNYGVYAASLSFAVTE